MPTAVRGTWTAPAPPGSGSLDACSKFENFRGPATWATPGNLGILAYTADDGWLVDVVGLAKPGWNTSDDISETWSNNARCWSFLPQLDLCKNFCVNQKGGATRGVVGLLCLWPTGSAPPVPSPPPSPPTHPQLRLSSS
ncbi:hypothetical protein CSOJ01_06257 [Colletotrichum sojae]|uniref:Uncharacterized protein n=1 Tax=Colletotrichum sojae TaxID=2175907 RepID=A0A8H6JD95_9PEZI|nr:hypothetical protein CSOJ01_06257 [Colletotrichum sojae]